ncbi:unnamed protein product, partial [Porites evermanni]
VVATFLFNTGRIIKAVHIFNECLVLLNGKALETIKELTTPLVIKFYLILLDGYTRVYDHTRAIECGKTLLTGNNRRVGTCYGNLGTVFLSVGQYTKAEEYLQKALVIRKEIGDKEGEAADYGNLGTVFQSVGQYTKAEEYLQKALVIRKEIGDKEGEATDYGNLGTVFKSVGQYIKAEEYLQKALVIRKEIGDKEGEASAYGNLGTVFRSVGQYTKAEEYLQKA